MKALPQLMFQGGVLPDVLGHWQRAFPDLTIKVLAGEETRPNLVELELAGQVLRLFDSPPVHDFTFTPSISLVIEAEAAEIDRLVAILGEGGRILMPLGAYDFSPHYCWLEDCFGVSWQLMVAP